ncbi:hypothetical protein GCM10010403_35910 [Glycomyces rutgersensis]|uniref:Uncharacterized protein n=1 Tax=Glycomyces rutgersensis TaxID=58115 RepID=A0ABN3FY07_9ACTN
MGSKLPGARTGRPHPSRGERLADIVREGTTIGSNSAQGAGTCEGGASVETGPNETDLSSPAVGPPADPAGGATRIPRPLREAGGAQCGSAGRSARTAQGSI